MRFFASAGSVDAPFSVASRLVRDRGDEFGHLRTEARPYVIDRPIGVFDDVVEPCGHKKRAAVLIFIGDPKAAQNGFHAGQMRMTRKFSVRLTYVSFHRIGSSRCKDIELMGHPYEKRAHAPYDVLALWASSSSSSVQGR